MLEDKIRWNERYQSAPMPSGVAKVVAEHYGKAEAGRALDIACGKGRHATFLAHQGFTVDAIDFSDYALAQIENHPNIIKIEADLDDYRFVAERYALIVNCNYLNRGHFASIREALQSGGLLIYETFLQAEGEGYHQPSKPEYLLQPNELLRAFASLHILYYEERDSMNLRGEKVKIAALAARRDNA